MVAGGDWQLTLGVRKEEEEGGLRRADVVVLSLWLNVEPVLS